MSNSRFNNALILIPILFLFIAIFNKIFEFLNVSQVAGLQHSILFLTLILTWLFYSRRAIVTRSYLTLLILNYLYAAFLILISENIGAAIYGFFCTFAFSIVFIFSQNIKFSEQDFFTLIKRISAIIIILTIPSFIEALIELKTFRGVRFFLFRELGALGSALNFCLIAFLTLYMHNRKGIFLKLAVIVSMLVFFTVLKKSIAISILIWILYFYTIKKINFFQKNNKIIKKNYFIELLLISISFLVLSGNLAKDINANIDYFENAGSDHVRIAMYRVAIEIFADYFPIGSGFGTYLSPASIIGNFSNLYYKYGLSDIYYFSEGALDSGAGMFFDAYWAHIIAELGFIGVLLYIPLWFYPLKALYNFSKNNNDIKKYLFFIVSLNLLIFLEGFVLYTPELVLALIYNNFIVGIAYQIAKKKTNNAQYNN